MAGETKTLEDTVKEAVEMFRPQLQADGGDMEYVSLDDQNRVHLKLVGACGSCPMAVMTLKMGVERYLKDACPDVTEVVQDMDEGM
ncbi:MAG TPA: NifU family protein [Treponema sp.]|nr:NifU family protein [Treponema sp.]